MSHAARVGLLLVIASTLDGASAQHGIDTAAVDAVFTDYSDTQSPGCALGIVQAGTLVYGRGYGMANLEYGLAISTETVFRTGSVSKQFTAAAVGIAVEDGYLTLDDPLRKWVPDIPDYGEPLTIRHLIHHTSGLRDYLTLMRLRGLRRDDFYTDEELLEVQVRQKELNFTPGSEFLYSNSGYVLLSQVILRATGRSLRAYAEEVIFGPLGMTHSHFHDNHNHVVPGRADGYAPLEDRGYRTSMTTLDMVGDGGVYTSVEDLVHWVSALQQDGLRPGLTQTLETRGVLTSGDQIPYAFGQRHSTCRDLPVIAHGGSFVGFSANITRFPSERTSIVTLCNRADANPSAKALAVAEVVLADRMGTPAPERQTNRDAASSASEVSEPSPYEGTYYSPELDVEYRFQVVEDAASLVPLSTKYLAALRVRAGAGIDEEVRQLSPDTLRAGPMTFRFVRSGGRVTGFELDAGRVQHVRFERVVP